MKHIFELKYMKDRNLFSMKERVGCFEKGANISDGRETRVLSETAQAYKSTLDQERQKNYITSCLTLEEMVLRPI